MVCESAFAEVDSLQSDVATLTKQFQEVSSMLAKLCRAYDASVSPSPAPLDRAFMCSQLQAWWRDFKKDEVNQRALIDREAKRKRVARAGLRKLTVEERAALGVTSGKRT